MATVDQASGQADLQQLLAIYNAGKLAKAERRAKALIERFPDALVLRNILGASLLDQGKTSDAVDCFRSALELEPRSPEGHNNLGIALQRHGAYEEAATSYREAVNLKPDHAEAHNNLGVVLADLGLNDAAIESYRSALAHAPDFAEAHNNLGAAFAEIGAQTTRQSSPIEKRCSRIPTTRKRITIWESSCKNRKCGAKRWPVSGKPWKSRRGMPQPITTSVTRCRISVGSTRHWTVIKSRWMSNRAFRKH